jgi:predicted ATPase
VGEYFVLSEQRPVKVKGKARPVRNFVVSGSRERPRYGANIIASPIVGRDEELEIGRAAVDRARAGAGGLLVISGASGIGKTRLAEEIILYGQSLGMDLLSGACLSYGQTMPYHPWADILRAYLGLQSGDDAATRARAVQRALRPLDETPWAPLIGDVLGLDLPGNDLSDALDAKLRRQRLLDLILKLLQTRSRRQPLILVIEDAHWADPASTDLINYIARNIAGYHILCILSYRLDKDLPELTTHAHATSIPLQELTDETCLEIVQEMIGPAALPDTLRDLILSKGAGTPFFVEEVLRALVEAGALRQDQSGAWQAEQNMPSVALPDTIHGVIISRIDRLPQIERQVWRW